MHLAAYAGADVLLVAENDAGVQNFVRHGIPLAQIKRYNNCVDTDVWVPSPKKRNQFTFVCWCSALGLRKGLPSLVRAWERWYGGQDAELLLVGMPSAVSRLMFEGRTTGEVMPGLRLFLEGYPPQDPAIIELVGSCHV